MTDAPDPIAQSDYVPGRFEMERYGELALWLQVIEDGIAVEIVSDYSPRPRDFARAAYIIEACNAYPGLVAALREARQEIEGLKMGARDNADWAKQAEHDMRAAWAERDALKAGLRDVLAYVDASPCDPDITADQRATWSKVAPARALLSGESHP